MKHTEENVLLRIFISENARMGHMQLYEQIVYHAHELGIAGATVLRGIMGFGAGRVVQNSRILAVSDNLPVVIEIIDSAEKIEQLMPFIDEHVTDGFVTTEKIRVVRYRSSEE